MRILIILFALMYSVMTFAMTGKLPQIEGQLLNHTNYSLDEIKLSVRLKCVNKWSSGRCSEEKVVKAIINSDGAFTIPSVEVRAEWSVGYEFQKQCVLSTPDGTTFFNCTKAIGHRLYRQEMRQLTVYSIQELPINIKSSNNIPLEGILASIEKNSLLYAINIVGPDLKVKEYQKNIVNNKSKISIGPLVYMGKYAAKYPFRTELEVSDGLNSLHKYIYSGSFHLGELPHLFTEIIINENNIWGNINGFWNTYLKENESALQNEFDTSILFANRSVNIALTCHGTVLAGTLKMISGFKAELEKTYLLSGFCDDHYANAVIDNFEFNQYFGGDVIFYGDVELEINYIGKTTFLGSIKSLVSNNKLYKIRGIREQ